MAGGTTPTALLGYRSMHQQTLKQYQDTGAEKPWRDESTLHELYIERDLTMKECAEELGCASSTISKWVNIHRFPKHHTAIRYPDEEPIRLISNEYGYLGWRHQYRGERWWVTVHRLAAVAWFGLDKVKGKVVHHENGFKLDNRESNLRAMTDSNHSEIHAEGGCASDRAPWRDEETFREVLEDTDTDREAAGELGCHVRTVYYWKEKFGI